MFICSCRSDLSDTLFVLVTCRFSTFSLSYPVLIVAVSPCFASKAFNPFSPIEESDQQRQKVTHVDCNDIQQNNPQIFSYQVPYFFQCYPLPCSYFYCLATNTFMNPRGQNILSFILNVFENIQSVHDPDIESSFSKFVKHEKPEAFLCFSSQKA